MSEERIEPPRPRRRGLRVLPGLLVPESEIVVRRTRSGGPGGQNVNKVATRVELEFDVASSSALDAEEKARVRERLAGRASRDGVVRVVGQRYRSQARNEEDARTRLAALLARALAVPKLRRPTRPTTAARRQRLAAKKQRAVVKSRRRAPHEDDWPPRPGRGSCRSPPTSRSRPWTRPSRAAASSPATSGSPTPGWRATPPTISPW